MEVGQKKETSSRGMYQFLLHHTPENTGKTTLFEAKKETGTSRGPFPGGMPSVPFTAAPNISPATPAEISAQPGSQVAPQNDQAAAEPLEARETIRKYLTYLRVAGKSPRTIKYAIHCLKRFAAFLETQGIYDLRHAHTKDLGQFKEDLYHYRKKDLSPLDVHTQKSTLAFVKSFFGYLVRVGTLPLSPARNLCYPRLPRRISQNHLSIPEMKAFLETVTTETVTGLFDRTLFEVFYAAGLRQGEVLKITWDDINFETGPGRSPCSLLGHATGLLQIRQGKGQRDRTVPLTQTALKYLGVLREKVLPRYLSVRKGADKDTPLVFPNMMGKSMLSGDLHRKMIRYRVLAGLEKPISPHVFRRSLASHLLQNGVDLRYIQELLGHKNTKTTLEYLRITTEDLFETLTKCHPRCLGAAGKTHEEGNGKFSHPLAPGKLLPQNHFVP
jgi:integrase/recombinase XerD